MGRGTKATIFGSFFEGNPGAGGDVFNDAGDLNIHGCGNSYHGGSRGSQLSVLGPVSAESVLKSFTMGKAGVANHHDDFVTENKNRHSGWVFSSSTEFSYKSNLQERELAKDTMSARSLQGVHLTMNPERSISAACPWLNDDGRQNLNPDYYLTCNDGYQSPVSDGWNGCNLHGLRAKCPSSAPWMCAKPNSGASNLDYSCDGPASDDAATACTSLDGPRGCSSDHRSNFLASEVLILATPFPLNEEQKEDIERVLYLKNLPLFMRGHYTTDSHHEDGDSSTSTWDDLSLFSRHAQISAALEVFDTGTTGGGSVLKVPDVATITFPSDLLPPSSGFTLFAVNVAGQSTPTFQVTNDDGLQECLDKTIRAGDDSWKLTHCTEGSNTLLQIFATEEGLPLNLCEVEVIYTAATIGENPLTPKNETNAALRAPVEQTSVHGSNGAHLSNDGKEHTCAITHENSLSSSESQSLTLELRKGQKVDKVVVKTGSAATSSTYRVVLDGENIGETVRELSREPSLECVMTDHQTFVASKGVNRVSIFVEISEELAASMNGHYLEVCEVEGERESIDPKRNNSTFIHSNRSQFSARYLFTNPTVT